MFYLSCPECRKKISDDTAGYRCESCNKVYSECVPTYMLTAKVTDVSGSVFVCFPKELADPIMNGMSASEFKHFKE